MSSGPNDVQRYYDANTRALLAFGQGRSEGTLHRAVWGPGVTDRKAAMHYVHDQLARRLLELEPSGELRVLDLGAGVGASLGYLARSMPLRGTAVTLSPVQARAARSRFAAEGLAARLDCLEADYNELPDGLEPADAAFALESFVHGASPARFFAECARNLRAGGRLFVCDDFLSDEVHRTSFPAARWLERFREGWHVSSLLTEDEMRLEAARAGFRAVECLDLTVHLELDRPRDRCISALVRGFGWLPFRGNYFRMLDGGDALQSCLKRGVIRYLFMVFEREQRC